MGNKTHVKSGLIILAFLLVMVGSAGAQYATYWRVGTGNWSDDNNWSSGEPAGDHLAAGIHNGGTVQITQEGERCSQLNVGGGFYNSGNVEMSSGNLHTCMPHYEETVADYGLATFTQTGGLNNTDKLNVGYGAQGKGTYNLSCDGELFTLYQYIGYFGTGTFNQSGGVNGTWRTLTIGFQSSGDGTYNLSGTGELYAVHDECIGYFGMGTFNHSGGTNTVEDILYIAREAGSIGTYALSGGTLSAQIIEFGAGSGAFNFNAGRLSVGTFKGSLYNYGGTLVPGSPRGPTTRFTNILGNYEQQSTGVLEIELGGTDPGTQYGRLRVIGALTLNGTLNVVLVNGFNPQVDDQFLILDFNSAQFAGSFATINLPDLPEGLSWDTTQLYTTGEISVQHTPSTLTLLSPNGGETLIAGSTYPITWESSGTISDVTITYSTNDGIMWLWGNVPTVANSGSYEWQVPSTPSDQCLVRIYDAANWAVHDTSDAVFTIVPPPPPSLTLLSPTGGETLITGTTYSITWESSGIISDVTIEYGTADGRMWTQVDPPNIGNSGSYEWQVPSAASSQYRVWIYDAANPRVYDSSQDFTIRENPFRWPLFPKK